MINFLQETKDELKEHNKTFDDVIFVADYFQKLRISPEEFIRRAENIIYNDGYGLEEINAALVVVGKDFWLERHEYDGSEWWEYKSIPNIDDFTLEDKETGHTLFIH
nr:MAG TPA: protein of unknown function (DUF4909) [Caudoviricetes sp.]